MSHRYPRTARVNELLREVVAETLERLADADERLALLTVTGVDAEPDLRSAKVYLSSLPDDAGEALGEHRKSLQAAIGRQVRLKRTPQLSFAADPAVLMGERIEEVLRQVRAAGDGEVRDSEVRESTVGDSERDDATD